MRFKHLRASILENWRRTKKCYSEKLFLHEKKFTDWNDMDYDWYKIFCKYNFVIKIEKKIFGRKKMFKTSKICFQNELS